jgi:ubiquinone/menaquinone biosynthesis C-methylase UbiE
MVKGAAFLFLLLEVFHTATEGFQAPSHNNDGRWMRSRTADRRLFSTMAGEASATTDERRIAAKRRLLETLSVQQQQETSSSYPTIFIDRLTKEPLRIERQRGGSSSSSSLFLTGDRLGGSPAASRSKILLRSPDNTYVGYSDSYLDLLEPYEEEADEATKENIDGSKNAAVWAQQTTRRVTQALTPWLPPPLRSVWSTVDTEYLPMRDLFTNPAVSFAYERGWRQGFAQAGFPGPDREAELANDYFAPVVAAAAAASSTPVLLVDMSCATGLFTRRFADSNRYGRVLGCDYSPSMLQEAVRRRRPSPGRLDWIRLDVAQMPLADASVDVLHAGAAMHCWPELPKAVQEIYRVLKPGGRYFATTFLSRYFATLQRMGSDLNDGMNASEPSRNAFQYFQSVDVLRQLMEDAGFAPEKVQIEVLGVACVVIRCEK